MPAIAHQRCLHHPTREAVARCPECGQFYCRECITEHDDRVICSSCLRKHTAAPDTPRKRSPALWCAAAAIAGLLTAWIFFFLVGRVLVQIPAHFHAGTLWQNELTGSGGDDK